MQWGIFILICGTLLLALPWNVESTVKPQNCFEPKDTGLCKGLFLRFYYNPFKQRCQKFIYGGCKGNSNNFTKKRDCIAHCE